MTIGFEGAAVELVTPQTEIDGQLFIDDIDISESLTKISPEEIADATKSVASIGTALLTESPNGSWKKPDEIEVEFGIAIGAGGRLLVAKGDVKAHLKIKIKW